MLANKLDTFYRQRWMYFCTLTVCFSNLSMSMTASWTSPTLTALLHDKSSGVGAYEATILDVLLPGGALVGGFLGWLLIDILGRRSASIIGGILFLVSWIILGLFRVLAYMYVARFFAGLAVGVLYLSSGIYLAEVAPSSVRQVLFAVSQLFTNIGFLVEYLIGPYVSYRVLVSISIMPAIIYTICVPFIEESPYFLAAKGDGVGAEEALKRLRGRADVTKEIKAIRAVTQTSSGRLKALMSIQNRQALLLASGAMVVKQMTGGWALVSYAEPLLEEASVPPHLGSAILGVAKMFTSVATVGLTLYFGIKRLVTLSLFGISVSLVTLLAVFIVKDETNYDIGSIIWLPLGALISFFVFTDIGIGPFPSFIGAELFSQQAKGLGTLMALSVGHVFGLVTMALITSTHFTTSLTLFTVCSTLSIPVLHRYLVDTKGKTIPELQKPPLPPSQDLQQHI